MAKTTADDTIRELEAGIEWLREHAHDKIEQVEKDNPKLGESQLFQYYKAEVEKGLDGLKPEIVAAIAGRSFLELRRKRGGFSPDHVIGA